jgi:hypothetical protein
MKIPFISFVVIHILIFFGYSFRWNFKILFDFSNFTFIKTEFEITEIEIGVENQQKRDELMTIISSI